MSYRRIALSILTLIVVTVLTPVVSSLEVSFTGLTAWGQTVNSKKSQADRILEQGKEMYEKDKFQNAIKSFQKALTIYRKVKNVSGERETLINLGVVYTVLGNCTKTSEYYQQYLAIIPKPTVSSTPRFNNEKIWLYYWFRDKFIKKLQNDLDKTSLEQENKRNLINLLQEVERILYVDKTDTLKIKLEKIKAKLLLHKANKLHQTKNFNAAIKPYQEALKRHKYIKNYPGNIQALIGLGKNYMAMEEYYYATITFRHALIIAKEIKDLNSKRYIQQQLQTIKDKSNILKLKADSLDEKGIKQYKACQTKLAFDLWNQAAEISTGNSYIFSSAVDRYPRRVLSAQIEKLYKQGNKLHTKGKNKQAIQFLHQGLAMYQQYNITWEHRIEEDILLKLGIAYDELGSYQEAIQFYQQQLEIYEKRKSSEYIDKREAISLYYLGLALLKSGKPQQAEFVLRQNIQKLEKNRPSKSALMLNEFSKEELISMFDEEQYPSYPVLQKALIAQNKYEDALEISEQGRTRILSDSLVRLLEPEKVYKGIIDYGVVGSEKFPLVSKLPTFTQEQPTADLPSIKRIKKTAQEHEATLVEYSIVDSELYIWVIKPTGEITFRKSELKPLWEKENTTLAELVTNSRAQIGVRSRAAGGLISSYDPNAAASNNRFKQLHELLIKPIADLLPKNPEERVIFVPQQSLFLVPFPALQDESGKYLVEKHTILTAQSIQILDLTRKQGKRVNQLNSLKQDVLIVGNPTMPRVSLKIGEPPKQLVSLPGAETEAKEIGKIFNTKPLIGKDATETAVKQRLSDAKIIHLATHGLLDDFKDGSVPGAIALAPDGKDDGLLTANEILYLKINADLVILSACDTGQGKLTGDGVIGLSSSLISAGAPSVIVTLWTISDNSTAMLMTEFYRQLQQNPDKAQALRQAMLKTMKNHENPRDWAAFTLIGDAPKSNYIK